MEKKRFSYKDNKELCLAWQKGDKEAGNQLCLVNDHLISKVAGTFAKKYGQDLYDDFYQEGMIGLLEAAKRYDLSFDAEFSTYAMWHIRARIMRFEYERTRNVRIPSNVVMEIKRCTKRDTLYQELGYSDRIHAIAQDLDMTEQHVEWLLTLQYQFRHSKSLDVPISEDEELSLKETIEGTRDDLGNLLYESVLKKYTEAFLENRNLTERELITLLLRNGFVTGEEMTFEEIGKRFGVTRERVRQIEAKAYRKLRYSLHAMGVEADTKEEMLAV